MTYRYDPDLEFLQSCSTGELEPLCSLLEINNQGTRAWITTGEKLQAIGKESLKDILSNGRILYKDILIDVCKKLKVEFNSNYPTEKIETHLLQKIKEEPLYYSSLKGKSYLITIPSIIAISKLREKNTVTMNI